MAVDVIWVVVGMTLLIFGAERLVTSAERLAHHFGMSAVLIGAVVVGLGTSLPEMLISGLAAARPNGLDLATGNIVGSNIANLSLVLGVAIIIVPLRNVASDLRREWLAMLAGCLLMVALAWNNGLSRWNGVVLAVAMAAALALLVRWSRDVHPAQEAGTEAPSGFSAEIGEWMEKAQTERTLHLGGLRLPVRPALWVEFFMALVSLALTLWGADRLVDGASGIAERLDISGGLVGLTIVALGTSLPELATAVAAARHGNTELVIGNVLGSNLFNALAVGGIAGLVGNGAFTGDFRISLTWMIATAVVAGGMANGLRGFDRLRVFRTGGPLSRRMATALARGDTVFSRWSQTRAAGVVLVVFYPTALILAGL